MTLQKIPNHDVNLMRIMAHLCKNDAVSDEIMEIINDIGHDYKCLQFRNEILEEKVNIDSKTNLLKYREDFLALILKSASRMLDSSAEGRYNLAYIRFDLDNFSFLNNRFGHEMGDRVLTDIAHLLKENSRPTDYVIRFGGEEFDVMLPATDITGAKTYLNKIYTNMQKLQYTVENKKVTISASAGVSLFSMPLNNLKSINTIDMNKEYIDLQKLADDALYDAKISGKNQFKVHDMDTNYQAIRKAYSKSKLMAAS
ncbi:MAG: GGDEF domain-containing protein [bacterium]|nr:GGDEF domain-containing protein [bacterium]